MGINPIVEPRRQVRRKERKSVARHTKPPGTYPKRLRKIPQTGSPKRHRGERGNDIPDVTAHDIPDVITHDIPDVITHDIPDVITRDIPDVTIRDIPDVI